MVKVFGENYFCLEKSKKVGPFVLKRYQVMGITLPGDEEFVHQEIARIKQEYAKDWRNISFQLGLNNEIISFENVSHRSKEFTQDMRKMRLNVREYLTSTYDINVTIRENMPQCEILYDITKTDTQLLAEMNS
jgi:hypothetical protein